MSWEFYLNDSSGSGPILLLLHPLEGKMAGKSAAAAQGALDFEFGAMALQHVLHNRKAEAGTTGSNTLSRQGPSCRISASDGEFFTEWVFSL